MVNLDITEYLSKEQPLKGGFPLFASVQDCAFAQGILLDVTVASPCKLLVKQLSFILATDYCISEHQLQPCKSLKLYLPKLKGLAQLEFLASADLQINYAVFFRASPATIATYAITPSDVNISQYSSAVSFARFADSLKIIWDKPANVILSGVDLIKGNEAYSASLTSLYMPLAVQASLFSFELQGTVSVFQQTNYFSWTIANETLHNREATLAVYRLATAVAQSSVLTNTEVIHVQL